MGRNAEYWKRKEENMKKAIEHTEEMAKRFVNEIKYSFINTKIYSPSTQFSEEEKINDNMEIKIIETDSVSALFNQTSENEKVVVLNFADNNKPGGMFMEGSRAQEESLCHESFLYNVLAKHVNYYAWNVKNKNRGMFTNRALYIPNVGFEREGKIRIADVLTCASPNKNLHFRYKMYTVEENTKALAERIKFICNILNESDCDVAILGAFGCGAFKQDPNEVASLFKENLTNVKINKIIFPIPGGENLKVFGEIFLGE